MKRKQKLQPLKHQKNESNKKLGIVKKNEQRAKAIAFGTSRNMKVIKKLNIMKKWKESKGYSHWNIKKKMKGIEKLNIVEKMKRKQRLYIYSLWNIKKNESNEKN